VHGVLAGCLQVAKLQEELTAMEPKLVATQKEVEEMIVTLEADKKTAAETKVRVAGSAAAVAPCCVLAGCVLSQAKRGRDLFLPHWPHSISFTRAQGIPTFKMGWEGERMGGLGKKWLKGGGGRPDVAYLMTRVSRLSLFLALTCPCRSLWSARRRRPRRWRARRVLSPRTPSGTLQRRCPPWTLPSRASTSSRRATLMRCAQAATARVYPPSLAPLPTCCAR
jgi:hypothetical protein